MANLFQPSLQPILDDNGDAVSGGTRTFYATGGSTLATIYSDAAGTTPMANPVIANSAGRHAVVYLDPDTTYRVVEKTAAAVILNDVDPVRGFDETQLSTDAAAAVAAATQTAADAIATAADAVQTAADRVQTGLDVTAAENARDATLAGANIYADTTAGLAGTSSGQGFQIPSATSGGYADLYLNSSGSAVDQNKTLATLEYINETAGRYGPFITLPSVSSALERLLEIELYTEVDGVTLNWPANIGVREIAADGVDRFRFRLGAGTVLDADSAYDEVAAESTGSQLNRSYAGLTTEDQLDLYARNTDLGVPADTVVGKYRIRFDGTTFGTYGIGPVFPHSQGGLKQSRILPTAVDIANAQKVARDVVAEDRAHSPLRPAVTENFLRAVIDEVYVEGGDPGHDYLINYEKAFISGTTYRVRFTIYDATLGINLCRWSIIDTEANLLARSSPTIFLTQGDLASYTGATATMWINWASLPSGSYAATTYTDVADSGIRADRIITRQEIEERFTAKAEPKIKLTVGAGTVTATHFNSFAAAITSLYTPGLTITRSTYPCSDICTFSNQVLIECVDDDYSESIAATTISSTDQSTVLLPHFITLRGAKDGNTRLYMNAAPNTAPVLEGPHSWRLENLHVENEGGGYSVHNDNGNTGQAKRAEVGPAILRYALVQVAEDCTLETGASMLTWNLGCGISNGHRLTLRRSRFLCATSGQAIGIHNSPSTTDAGLVEIEDCYCNDSGQAWNALALSKSAAQDDPHDVVIRNCDFAKIDVSNSAGGDPGYRRVGKIDSDITVTGTLSV